MGQGQNIRNPLVVEDDVDIWGDLSLGENNLAGDYRNINFKGSAIDVGLDVNLKGSGVMRAPVGYESNVGSETRAFINKGYHDINFASNPVSASVTTPGAGEDMKALLWDNANTQWDLFSVALANTFQDGVNESALVVRLGGAVTQALTDVNLTAVGDMYFRSNNGTNPAGFRAYSTLLDDNRASMYAGSNVGIEMQNASFLVTANLAGAMAYAADYSGQFSSPRTIIDKDYAQSYLGTKLLTTTAKTPTGTQDGWVVYWDNPAGRYGLKVIGTGSANWGSISGTITAQTDMINYFWKTNGVSSFTNPVTISQGGHQLGFTSEITTGAPFMKFQGSAAYQYMGMAANGTINALMFNTDGASVLDGPYIAATRSNDAVDYYGFQHSFRAIGGGANPLFRIIGAGATSATAAMQVLSSGSSLNFQVTDDGLVKAPKTMTVGSASIASATSFQVTGVSLGDIVRFESSGFSDRAVLSDAGLWTVTQSAAAVGGIRASLGSLYVSSYVGGANNVYIDGNTGSGDIFYIRSIGANSYLTASAVRSVTINSGNNYSTIISTTNHGNAGVIGLSIIQTGNNTNSTSYTGAFKQVSITGTVQNTTSSPQYDIGLSLRPTFNYTNGAASNNYAGIYYDPVLTATAGLTHYFINAISGIVKIATPTQNDTNVRVLTINDSTNHVEWRDSSTIVTPASAYWATASGGTLTSNNIIDQGNLNTITYRNTVPIATASIIQDWYSDTTVLVSQLYSTGIQEWNIYSLGINRGRLGFAGPGNNGPGITFQDSALSDRYDVMMNTTWNTMHIYKTSAGADTRVGVGFYNNVQPTAVLHIRGTATTGTNQVLRADNSSGTERFSITDSGLFTFTSTNRSNTISVTHTATTTGQSSLIYSGTATLTPSTGHVMRHTTYSNTAVTGVNNQELHQLHFANIYQVDHNVTNIYGIYYNPTITGAGTNTHFAAVFGSGSVGIGTLVTTAGTRLDVVGISAGTNIARFATNANTEVFKVLEDTTMSFVTTLPDTNTSGFALSTATNDKRIIQSIRNSNAGSSAVGILKFYNNGGTGSTEGADIGYTSSGYSQTLYGTPSINALVIWNYEQANIVFGTNNVKRLTLTGSGRDNTWTAAHTATASLQSQWIFDGTATNIASGTSTIYGMRIASTLQANGGAGNTHTQIGLYVNPTFAAVGGATTVTNILARFSNGGNDVTSIYGGTATNDGTIQIGNNTAPLVISRVTGNRGAVSFATAGGLFGTSDNAFTFSTTSITRSGTGGSLDGYVFDLPSVELDAAVINFSHVVASGTFDGTSTGVYIGFDGRPVFTDWDGDAIGFDWNPTTPSNIAGNHLAYRATSGQVLFGGTSITADTRLDVIGISGGNIQRWASSGLTQKMILNDAGTLTFPDGLSLHTSATVPLTTSALTLTTPTARKSEFSQLANVTTGDGYSYRFTVTGSDIGAVAAQGLFRIANSSFAMSSGTVPYTFFSIGGAINQTVSALGDITGIELAPTYTSALGTVYGFRYNPTGTPTNTHYAIWTGSGSGYYKIDAINSGITDNESFRYVNTTAATSGQQQYSPALIFEGSGWSTGSGASHVARWRQYNQTTSGSTNTQSSMKWQVEKNGGGFVDGMELSSNSFNSINLSIGAGAGSLTVFGINGLFSLAINKTNEANATVALDLTSVYGSAATNISFRHTTGGTVSTSTAPTYGYLQQGTYNRTGTATHDVVLHRLNHTYTSVIGNLYGYDYNPASGAPTGDEIAYRATQGQVLFGASALTTDARLEVVGESGATSIVSVISNGGAIRMQVQETGEVRVRNDATLAPSQRMLSVGTQGSEWLGVYASLTTPRVQINTAISFGYVDTSISRISAGVFGFGTGTTGTVNAQLRAGAVAINAGTPTALTSLEALGVATGKIVRLADDGNTERFSIDNDTGDWSFSTNHFVGDVSQAKITLGNQAIFNMAQTTVDGTGGSNSSSAKTILLWNTNNAQLTNQQTVFRLYNTQALQGNTTTENRFLDIQSQGYAPTSGDGTYITLKLTETINQTGGANGNIVGISWKPTYTAVGNDVTGYLYDPTVTSVTGDHIAYAAKSGGVVVGSTTDYTVVGLTASPNNGHFYVGGTANASVNIGTSTSRFSWIAGVSSTNSSIRSATTSAYLETLVGQFKITQNALTTTGGKPAFLITGGAHTSLTASVEVNDVFIDLNRTVQWATGAIATQRAVRIVAPTYSAVGSSTMSAAYTFYIDGPPAAGSNLSITTRYTAGFYGGTTIFGASVAAYAPINIPHGTAPTSPVDGDIWTTTASVYARVNGSTIDLGATGGGGALSDLTVATATNTINNADYTQEWQWNTLSGIGMNLTSTSTAAAANAQTVLNISTTGTNVTSTQTTYGLNVSNTHDGTSSTNIGAQFSASGGTTANYALITTSGFVGINTTAPPAMLTVKGNGGTVLLAQNNAGGTIFSINDSGLFAFAITSRASNYTTNFTFSGSNQYALLWQGAIVGSATTAQVFSHTLENWSFTTGATNQDFFTRNLAPTYTASHTGADFYGIYYNPTINGTETASATHYAAVFGSGLFGIGTITPTSATRLDVVGLSGWTNIARFANNANTPVFTILENTNTTITGTATAALFDTGSTTINFAGAATSLTIGATTGTMTLRNATITHSNSTESGAYWSYTDGTSLFNIVRNDPTAATYGLQISNINTTAATSAGLALIPTGTSTTILRHPRNGYFTVLTVSSDTTDTGFAVYTGLSGTGVNRFTIAGNGSWGLGGSAGTSGQVLTSGGTGGPPTWTTVGTIGGSITDNQVAIGAATSNTIEGSSSLTYNGTTMTFASATTVLELNATSTAANYIRIHSNGGTSGIMYLGQDDNTGASFTGTAYGRFLWMSGTIPFYIYTNSGRRVTITSTGALSLDTATTGIGTAVDWVATSDRRLKENIVPYGSVTEKIRKMNGMLSIYNRIGGDKVELGMIAQDVMDVFPEIVGITEKGMHSLSYSRMGAIALQGLIEVDNEVTKLKKRVSDLEEEVKSLRAA